MTGMPMVVDITRRERSDAYPYPCERCTAPIKGAQFNSGTSWTPQQLAAYGQQKFSMLLCMDCYRKANKERRWAKQGRMPGQPGARTADSVISELDAFVRALKANVAATATPEEAIRAFELLDLVGQRIEKIRTMMKTPPPTDNPSPVTLPDR